MWGMSFLTKFTFSALTKFKFPLAGMAKNSGFLEQVSAIFRREDEIIIGCHSGRRSLMAAAELCSAGFTAVTDIAGGFTTWRENGLPVSGPGHHELL